MIRLSFITALAAFALAGCQTFDFDAGYDQMRRASDDGVCHVHFLPLQKVQVPIYYGDLAYHGGRPSSKTWLTRFPFSWYWVGGGCLYDPGVSPEFRTVSHCSGCLKEKERWMKSHPTSPWVRDEIEAKERQPNQALQTTSMARSGFGRVSVSDRQKRGV